MENVDLSIDTVSQFWKDYEDPMIFRVVAFMEGVEAWTLDGDPDLEMAMAEFSNQLSDISAIDLGEFANEELFIRIACNLRTGRALRLLQAVDTAHPGAASRLLIHAEETSETSDDPAGVFLRRNIVFERLRLLARVFSQERFALILRALEGEE